MARIEMDSDWMTHVDSAVHDYFEHDLGPDILHKMQTKAPVKTGALRESLGMNITDGILYVGSGIGDRPAVDYAYIVENGSRPHIIRPKNPDGVLRFEVDGTIVFTKEVHHPGTPATHFMRESLYEERR
jgi:hypothetical protein